MKTISGSGSQTNDPLHMLRAKQKMDTTVRVMSIFFTAKKSGAAVAAPHLKFLGCSGEAYFITMPLAARSATMPSVTC